jgi:phosphate starvation-inducible PhoH-like protein
LDITLELPEGEHRIDVTGSAERNLKIIRETLGVHITARNGKLTIRGDDEVVGQATRILEQLTDAAMRHEPMSRKQLVDVIVTVTSTPHAEVGIASGPRSAARQSTSDLRYGMDVYLPGKRVKAMTDGQQAYLEAIFENDLTFCSGPAGTGKTYLAVAAAVSMLKRGQVRKLVLVRPAVEAGEKLGFLPGDLQEKVNPYVRPLLDALHDMMEFDHIQRFMACDLIEIVPLAFMRGRTLNDALIILDEAQNTTKGQMLMFLTRLGMGGKMIVTGDTSQIDLEDPRDSGLIDAVRRLRRVPGVGMVALDGIDIVRHKLVQRIVKAYESGKSATPGAYGTGDTPDSHVSDKMPGGKPDGQAL